MSIVTTLPDFNCKLCYGSEIKKSYSLGVTASTRFEAVECRQCGLFQVRYNWQEAPEFEVIYDFDLDACGTAIWASEADLAAHANKGSVFANLLSQHGRLLDQKILDIGCGKGKFLRACLDQGARSVTGQEFRASHIAHARAREGIADIRSAETHNKEVWPDAEFDVVASLDVVEHVHDLGGFLEECVRVCKPGGVLMHATPGYDSVSHRIGRALAGARPTRKLATLLCNVQYVKEKMLGGEHVSIMGRDQLRWLAGRYNVEPIHAEYVSSYSYSDQHYAAVIPFLKKLPTPVGAAIFKIVRSTIKNKFVFIAGVNG